jgi:predicted ATP-grasp superfamily ATP-dependent carboligase
MLLVLWYSTTQARVIRVPADYPTIQQGIDAASYGDLTKNVDYQKLIERIGNTYQSAKSKIISAVNTEMLHAYWQIGKDIIEFEQGGKLKAEYGKQLLENLAKDLSLRFGQGFSRSNLNYMRLLYNKYPICETLSHKLSWSH